MAIESFYLPLLLVIIASVAMACMDKVQHHWSVSVFRDMGPWWNPKESWRYKWKNGDPAQGERFPGSSTVFVFLTDFWHLAKWVMLKAVVLAIAWPLADEWYWKAAAFVGLHIVWSGTFQLFFSIVLKKKQIVSR